MTRGRAASLAFFSITAGYLGFILLGGAVFGSCISDKVEQRLGEALAAEVSIGSSSVFIASGNSTFRDITIRRDGVEIMIGEAEVSMAAGGLMVFRQNLDQVVAKSVSAELSARGAVALAIRDRAPIHIDDLIIEDARVSISPTLIIPGLGRIEATIERAQSRDVNLASAVSWIAKLDEMTARAELPGGAGAGLGYKDGKLDLSGSWFGSNPLSIPFEIPKFGPELLEIEQLKIIGRSLAVAVAKHVATDRLLDAAKSLLD